MVRAILIGLTAILISSCGNYRNFNKQKYTGLNKIKTEKDNSVLSESSAYIPISNDDSEYYENESKNLTAPSDMEHSLESRGADETTIDQPKTQELVQSSIENCNTLRDSIWNKAYKVPRKERSPERRTFDKVHWTLFWTLASVPLLAVGWVIVAFGGGGFFFILMSVFGGLVIAGIFVLCLLQKLKYSKAVPQKDRDVRYKIRKFFDTLLLYCTGAFVLLMLILIIGSL